MLRYDRVAVVAVMISNSGVQDLKRMAEREQQSVVPRQIMALHKRAEGFQIQEKITVM